ncbi:hypothetical protein ACLMJK_002492 [Lecanora helva]
MEKARSSSQDSVRTVQRNKFKRRASENHLQRVPSFLGRHPPPLQRRSNSMPLTKLPDIFESARSGQYERELLFIGDDRLDSRRGYHKVPRLVPHRIERTRLNLVAISDRSGGDGDDAQRSRTVSQLLSEPRNSSDFDSLLAEPPDESLERASDDSNRSQSGKEAPRIKYRIFINWRKKSKRCVGGKPKKSMDGSIRC